MNAITNKKDSVLAVVLLLLLLFLFLHHIWFIYAALIIIPVTLLSNRAADIVNFCWRSISKALAVISSTIILSLLFYCIVWPMGFLLRITGKNSLILKTGNRNSTFRVKNKLFSETDLKNPF